MSLSLADNLSHAARGARLVAVPAETMRIIFEELTRALDRQVGGLDQLRARSGTVVAAAALVTSFLGAEALARTQTVRTVLGEHIVHSNFGGLEWAAVACFVAVLAFNMAVLIPRRFLFGHDAHELLDAYGGTEESSGPEEIYRNLADYNELNAQSNEQKLKWLYRAFTTSLVFLVGETILWLLGL